MKTFYRRLLLLIIFICITQQIFCYEFKIAKVGPNYVMSTLRVRKDNPRPTFRLFMIYDIFERMEIIDGKRVFINYVDSVYLRDIRKEELYFAFTWEGEGRLLKKNYILLSTDRFYSFPGTPIKEITISPDIHIRNPEDSEEKKESGDLPTAPKFAFMFLSGYTLLHSFRYDGTTAAYFGPGYITSDLVFFLPFNLGIRLSGAIRQPWEDIYIQASGINYRGLANAFVKVYTELGAGYPLNIAGTTPAVEPSVILLAQYGILFDFRGLFEWGYFAIDLYASGHFPVNTILEGMYINYGLKVGVRF